MSARSLPDKFLVAFSFAGEERELVRAIAEAVETELGRGTVFLDEWFEHGIAGIGADQALRKIYGEGCALAVLCVSKPYGEKAWPGVEHAAIRARVMQAYTASDKRERHGVLPIRVGDGEVEGILFNDIVPDVRLRSPVQAAELVIERLRLVKPDLKTKSDNTPVAASWPETSSPLPIWPVADHSEARMAFECLLTRDAPWRYLPLRGDSETGKTHITGQMLANAMQMPNLACGRFDFKGTTDIDAEIRTFVQNLEVPEPAGSRLNERLSHVLDALKQRARPALLILDTYEAAGQAQAWVEKELLVRLMRDPWLRVVIAGQCVPDSAGAVWAKVARAPIELALPPPEAWHAFGQSHKPGVDLDHVRWAHESCRGKASTLMELLGPRKS